MLCRICSALAIDFWYVYVNLISFVFNTVVQALHVFLRNCSYGKNHVTGIKVSLSGYNSGQERAQFRAKVIRRDVRKTCELM